MLAVTALAVVYFLVSGAFNAIRSQQLRGEQGRLETEVQGLQERYQRLQALEDYLDADEYIEAVAREQLGLVRPGETGFVVISTVPSPTPDPAQAADQPLWWDVLIR